MKNKSGYYKGLLEFDGFKTPFVVYASSNEHAAEKVLENELFSLENAIISKIEGPYQSVHHI